MNAMGRTLIGAVLVVSWILGGSQYSHAKTRHYDLGDRLSVEQICSTDGQVKLVSFETPSIVILWSTWSTASLTALEEVLDGAPSGGVRWQVVPINVDAPSMNASDTSRINSAARQAGWNGPVWYDRDYRIMDSWGVIAIPTLVITSLGGAIDEIEHDWSAPLRDRLFVLYFGAVTDSFPGMTTPASTPQCRTKAESARRLWRMNKKPGAIAVMMSVADSCDGLPDDIARLADWRWSVGDSLRQGLSIAALVRNSERSAWTQCARASFAARRGDDSGAVALCQEAIARDSAFLPAWLQLSGSSLQISDSATAISAYERARVLNRWDARVLQLGASLAETAGEFVESALLMKAAVECRLRRSGR